MRALQPLAHRKWRQRFSAIARQTVIFFLYLLQYRAWLYDRRVRMPRALSTSPLQAMTVGALLGIHALPLRKALGVAIATTIGVIAALTFSQGAARRLARQSDHSRRGVLHGLLSFYNVSVISLYRALERIGISLHRMDA